MPPLAKGTKAPVSSRSVTSEVPSAIDGVAFSGDDAEPPRGPHDGLRADLGGSCTETVLSDSASAVVSVTAPRYLCV